MIAVENLANCCCHEQALRSNSGHAADTPLHLARIAPAAALPKAAVGSGAQRTVLLRPLPAHAASRYTTTNRFIYQGGGWAGLPAVKVYKSLSLF